MNVVMKNTKKIYYSKNISWTLLVDEIFIFDEETNEMFLLRGIMKEFWLLISKTENYNEIINTLAMKNNFEKDIYNKILSKTKELCNKNLIIMEEII